MTKFDARAFEEQAGRLHADLRRAQVRAVNRAAGRVLEGLQLSIKDHADAPKQKTVEGLVLERARPSASPTATISVRPDRVQLMPDCLYFGSANVLPTTANPLNGWMTADRGGHVIIPQLAQALKSIPRMASQAPRYATTTGTVTQPNYTARAACQKSLHHHTYGALVVEMDTDGEVFLRHVIANEAGEFQDIDVFVSGGTCTPDRRVRANTYGDIHHQQLDPVIAKATWGIDLATGTRVAEDSSGPRCQGMVSRRPGRWGRM